MDEEWSWRIYCERKEGLIIQLTSYLFTVIHGLLLGALEAVGHIIEWLELSYGVFGDTRNLWLKVLQLWLVG